MGLPWDRKLAFVTKDKNKRMPGMDQTHSKWRPKDQKFKVIFSHR